MIEIVDNLCEDWSAQYRKREYPLVGYPPLSELGSFTYTHKPTWLTQEANDLSLAVEHMGSLPEMRDAYAALIVHYLFAGRVKAKYRWLAIDQNTYPRRIDRAHTFLLAILQPLRRTG